MVAVWYLASRLSRETPESLTHPDGKIRGSSETRLVDGVKAALICRREFE